MLDTLPIYDTSSTVQLICLIAMKINNLSLLSLIISPPKSIHFPLDKKPLQITTPSQKVLVLFYFISINTDSTFYRGAEDVKTMESLFLPGKWL